MNQRRILIVCAGNTCRGPTLMLLLRHRARQLGLEADFAIESAGLTPESSEARPMLFPAAQEAVVAAAHWLDETTKSPVDNDRLALVTEEAAEHRSRRITALTEFASIGEVVALVSHKRLRRDAPEWVSTAPCQFHPVRDTAYGTYAAYRRSVANAESHPEVVKAYLQQARRLAQLLVGPLGPLLRP
jgi:protein-tyrosine-phosphatase